MIGDDLIQIAILFAVAATVSWLVTRAVWHRATHLGLIDTPNERSSHVVPTPRGGGLGFIVSGLAGVVWLVMQGHDGRTIFAAILSIVLALMGLLDDRRSLPAMAKFAVQTLVCAAFVYTLGGGLIEQIVLVVAGVWWINLFNFMDGIDGIAGIEALIMLTVGAAVATTAGPLVTESAEWTLMVIVAGAVIGFLWHNWPPARIFMGDAGSNWLAFVAYVLALMSVRNGWLTYTAWLILAAVFVADATVTLLHRMARGERWFAPHRSHAYQLLAIQWHSHRTVTMLVACVNLLWLTPLAVSAVLRPEWALVCLTMAYAPLVVAAFAVRVQHLATMN